MLNVHSPIPLYRQLADRILADINAGVHQVASRIPSEHELAGAFDIGRPTVRQATDLLVRQGRLERRRGSGTYVLPPVRSIDLFSLAGTSAALSESDLDAKLTLVSGPVREMKSSAASGDQEAESFRVERCATVEGKPVLFETLWFNADLFHGLDKYSLADQSLSALVKDQYFLEPTSADQTFYAITADAKVAKLLNVAVGNPLLRVQRVLHFGETRDALTVEIICLTDQFEFSQTLYPGRVNAGVTNSAINTQSSN